MVDLVSGVTPVRRDAVLVVIREADRFLIVQRGLQESFAGYWGPLSGKLEVGETQAQAVKREAREEVGLDVNPISKFGEFLTPNGLYLLHWWRAEIIEDQQDIQKSKTAVVQNHELAALTWVTFEEYLKLNPRFEEHADFLKRSLESS